MLESDSVEVYVGTTEIFDQDKISSVTPITRVCRLKNGLSLSYVVLIFMFLLESQRLILIDFHLVLSFFKTLMKQIFRISTYRYE